MSISASIDFTMAGENPIGEFSVKIIESFLSYGWRLDDEGFVSFLPYGDGGLFDWTRLKLSNEGIFDLVRKKQKSHEIVGVVTTWEGTGVGGSLLIYPDASVSFLASINRKLIGSSSCTDATWYFERILPAFSAAGFEVESFVFSQTS